MCSNSSDYSLLGRTSFVCYGSVNSSLPNGSSSINHTITANYQICVCGNSVRCRDDSFETSVLPQLKWRCKVVTVTIIPLEQSRCITLDSSLFFVVPMFVELVTLLDL